MSNNTKETKEQRYNEYIDKLRRIDFEHSAYMWISNDDLEEIDRPLWFDELYKACRPPFAHMFGMEVYEYNVVVTWLPFSLFDENGNAPSITLTKYRQWGKYDVRRIIEEQIDECNDFISTCVGDMRIFKTPILLKVRTKSDMRSSQVGETTGFNIIGIIDDPGCRDCFVDYT